MSHRQEVVVVDGLPETAQVLRAVLEPRGHSVTRRTSRQVSCDGAENSTRVLVLHDATDRETDGPRLIVGRISNPSSRGYSNETDAERRSLSVPFHYADLIAAIDAVMERAA